MATHSTVLAWRIQWTEEPGRLQSMDLIESDMTEQLTLSLHFPCAVRLVGCRLHTCFYQIAWQSHYILYSIKIWQPSLTPLIYLSKLMEAKPAFVCLLGANIKTLLVRWLLPKCFILYTWNFLREQILNFLTTHTHTHNGNYVEVKNTIFSLTIFPQGTHILKH